MAKKPYTIYKSEKENAENLVLIAGSGEGQARWKPFIPDLLKYYNVMTIDNPGIGVAPYEGDFSAESLAERYQGYINEVCFNQYHLIGHSFGTFIAQIMALNSPKSLKKLILIGGSCGSFNQERIINFQLGLSKGLILAIALSDDNLEIEYYKQLFGDDVAEKVVEDYMLEKRNIPSNVKFSYVLNSARFSSFAKLDKLKVPTLIVHGEFDRIVDFENGLILHDLIKNSRLLAVKGTGHYPYIEDSSVWPSMLDFLQGKNVGQLQSENITLPMKELLEEDKNFKKAVAKKDKYKALIVEIFINKAGESIELRHKKFMDFIS